MNKLEACVLIFVIACGFYFIFWGFSLCVSVEKPRARALGTGARQHRMAAQSHCNNTLVSKWWNLEASSKLYVTKTGVSHLKTGGKESPFEKTCSFFLFCLSCICFCIITVYGFCIKCIRVLGCKWNFIHILSKYLL